MQKCKNCIHSIYNETWGEYRCKKYEITIYTGTHENCKEFEEVKKNDKS